MFNKISIEELKGTVNEDALKALRDLSARYPSYVIFVCGINKSAENLPEVATAASGNASTKELRQLQRDYAYLLPAYMKKFPAGTYNGMQFKDTKDFNKELLYTEGAGFYVKRGEFFLHATRPGSNQDSTGEEQVSANKPFNNRQLKVGDVVVVHRYDEDYVYMYLGRYASRYDVSERGHLYLAIAPLTFLKAKVPELSQDNICKFVSSQLESILPGVYEFRKTYMRVSVRLCCVDFGAMSKGAQIKVKAPEGYIQV